MALWPARDAWATSMREVRTLIAAVLVGWALAAEGPFAHQASVHVLDNGLTVVIEESHRTDVVAMNLRYFVGSRDEHQGERGLAHLFEHLMFEGSRNAPGNAYDTWLTQAGGVNNAYTSEDATAYYASFPSGALDLALFLESDRMAWLGDGLTKESLANQIAVVLQERATSYDAPHGRDMELITTMLYPQGHLYHVPIIGTVADIEAMTLERALAFHKRFYRPRNAVLTLVGNLDTAEALARVEHWFSDVPDPGPAPPRNEPVEPDAGPGVWDRLRYDARGMRNASAQDGFTPAPAPSTRWTHEDMQDPNAVDVEEPPRVIGVLEDRVDDWMAYVAWRTVPSGHNDEAPLEVLSWLLANGRGTRLDDALYYKRNFALDDNTFTWFAELDGIFGAYVTMADPELAKAEAKLLEVFKKLGKESATDAELLRAKRSVRAGLLDKLETPADRAEVFSECWGGHGTLDCLAKRWEAIRDVTADEIEEVAELYLDPERRVSLSVVPEGKGGELEGATGVNVP